MTAKEYLRQIRAIEMTLKSLEEEIMTLETRARKVTSSWQSDPVQTTSSGDGMANVVIKIIEKKKDYENMWDKLIDKRTECEKLLLKMNNPLHYTILFEYYIKGKNWDQVSESIHFSTSYIKSQHGWALLDFEKVMLLNHTK